MQAQADKCRQMAAQLKRKADERQAALVLQQEQKRAAEAQAQHKPTGVKAVRKGPPAGTTLSGITLELVPLEPVAVKAETGSAEV